MSLLDDTAAPFALSYTIPTFNGQPGTVTDVLASSVMVNPVIPVPPSVRTYVIADPLSGPAAVKVSGSVAMAITLSDGSGNQFYPVGLAVQPTAARLRPDASLFPLAVVSGTTITLTDNDVPGAPTSYEFVVLFQDNNGYFGTLDPRIGNM